MHAKHNARSRPGAEEPLSRSALNDSLREKEAFNFALFQHNPLPMVVVDREGHVLKSNLARRALATPLPALDAPLFDPARGEFEARLAAGLRTAFTSDDVGHFTDMSLDNAWYNITIAPVPQGALVIMEDITARKQAQAEAERRQKQLIQADKMIALGNLVSGVAHEVSNPNNAMILSATALKRMCDDVLPILDRVQVQEGDFDVGMRTYSEVREELPDLIDVVGKAAQRIKSIVDDLKSYARKSTETLTETVDVNATLDAAVKLMNPILKKATHRFSVNKGVGVPTIAGNAQRIEQVIVNLLSNACQALPSQQSAVVASTRWEPAQAAVIIEVRDEGRGISPENLERITDPFFTTRQDDGGTGLGLSISKTIVESHKGQLTFASEVGKGTVAAIRLPAQNAGSSAREGKPAS